MEALVFDFDGVVLDTETPLYEAWSSIYQDHGVTLTHEEWQVCIGTKGVFDPIEDLLKKVDRSTSIGQAIINTQDQIRDEAHRRHVNQIEESLYHPSPGVMKWLDDALDSNLKIGMASSSSIGWLEKNLEMMGLRSYFFSVVGLGTGLRPKPFPDVYAKACVDLGVEPSQALAIEDSLHGLNSAKEAGLRCLAVPRGMTRSMDLSSADLVVESLEDISLKAVRQLIWLS